MGGWRTVCLIFVLHSASVFSKPLVDTHIALSTQKVVDPSDLSNIRNWTAIGDSYAAGIGAGTGLQGSGDSACSRYDNAYPILANQYFNYDTDSTDRAFQFIACSQATTSDVLGQVASLTSSSQDLVTVSAGGNDVGFSDVLKSCIYLASPDTECTAALKTASDKISHSLANNVGHLLSSLDPKMKPGGIVVYTLYARFFNAATDICDNVSWSFLDPTGLFGPKLTKQKRQAMNDLVNAANVEIKRAVTDFNSQSRRNVAKYVVADYDNFIGLLGGRFCEDGETSHLADMANVNEVFQRTNQGPDDPNEDLKLRIRASAGPIARNATTDGSAIERAIAKPENKTSLSANRQTSEKLSLPDFVARVFHPNEKGQSIIAQAAIAAYIGQRQEDLNFNSTLPTYCNLKAGMSGSLMCNGFASEAYMPYTDTQSAIKFACDKDIPRNATNDGVSTFNFADAKIDIFMEPFKTKLTSDDCQASLHMLIDHCDIPWSDPRRPNLLNEKHGGTYYWPDGEGYTRLTPLDDTHRTVLCQTPAQSGGKYAKSSDMYNNVDTFCNSLGPNTHPASASMQFQAGTAGDFEFGIYATGPRIFDAGACKTSMKDALDSCNVDPLNAINYRYAGAVQNQGITYTYHSNHVRAMPAYTAPIGECTSWYKVILAQTTVFGGAWADGDWGGSPGGLLQQMRGCEAVTGWKFDYFQAPDYNRYEWKSTFNLPIGTRRCVGRAMNSAGGPQAGCGGNG